MQNDQSLSKWTESISDNEDDPQSEMAAVEMPPNPLDDVDDDSQTEAPVMAEPTRPEPTESKLDENVGEQQESSQI